MKYGNSPEYVLQRALQQRIHFHITYISPSQLCNDVLWLFGALQASLLDQGKLIVKKYEPLQDNIRVWYKFIAKFSFGGNIQHYFAQQQVVLNKPFHPNSPGGQLAFLENFKEALKNMDYIHLVRPNSSDVPVFNDATKRELFSRMFTLENHTQELITGIENRTTTWAELADELRYQLMRRADTAIQTGKRRAHLTLESAPDSTIDTSSPKDTQDNPST